jgi:DNA-binding transcriptional MerR regulator
MKIGEVAGQAGVTVDTVRFYERVGVLPKPARTSSGYRDDTADAVDALAAHDAGGATCGSERWRLQAVLDRVDARLAELTALRERIVEAQNACADGRCMFRTTASSSRA